MKKYLKLFLCFIIIFIILVPSFCVYAEENYYTNSPDENVDELFEITNEDISNPLTWLKDRQTYIVIKESNEKYTYFFNTPNVQQILYNKAESILPTGYIGNGITPSKDTMLVSLPESEEAKTGLQKYGFRIPNLTYVGEQPRIYLSLSGVLIEQNAIEFVENKITGIFGGNYIQAPDISDLKTLEYLSPNDYEKNDNSFENWIDKYWFDVVDGMDAGQILISNATENGCKQGGTQEYVKDTIITQNNLDDESLTASQINAKLKSLLGSDYTDVCMNIIAVGIQNGDASGFENDPERIMPYDIDTLNDYDKSTMGIADPRVEKQDTITLNNIQLKLGLSNFISNAFSDKVIDFAGFISELTVFINSLTNFSTLEKIGLDPLIIWNSSIMKIFTAITIILFVILILKKIIDTAKGTKSAIDMVTKGILCFLLVGLLVFIETSPNTVYQATKTISTYFFNIGEISIENTEIGDMLMADGDAQEKSDCSYWIPYYSLWCKYNTGSDLSDDKIDVDNIENEPEQQNMEIPTIGEKEIYLWSANIAESVTSGSTVDNDIYRTVDHYLAPRISLDEDNKTIDSVTQNENYNGSYQSYPDIGLLLIILLIFLCVLIKLLLVLEAMYELMFFPIHLALYSIEPKNVGMQFKKLIGAFLRVGIWDLIISFFIYMTMLVTGALAFLMAICSYLVMFKIIKEIMQSNSVLKPRLLSKAQEIIR